MIKERQVSMFVVTGLSGAGKTTLIQKFLENHREFELCTSFTTRQVHDHEHYQYVEPPVFMGMLRRGEFLEAVMYATGEYYGTALQDVKNAWQRGHIPLLDINTDGLKQILKHPAIDKTTLLSVFVIPPDAYELKERLLRRHREPYEEIIVRLKAALHELDQLDLCGGIILNDSIQHGLAMMEYMYLFPKEGLTSSTETFRSDLKQIILQMENQDSLSTLQERAAYEYGSETSDPYERMKEAMELDLKDCLSKSLRIILSCAAANHISIQELAYGKDD